jgi:uncharacterized protein YbcI
VAETDAGVLGVEEQISAEILRIHEDSYGLGAHRVATHVVGDFVFTVLDVELSRSERTLLDHGHAAAVRSNREAFQEAIGATFSAAVERVIGRRVVSFFSHMNLDPPYAIEGFRLADVPAV